MKRADLGGLRVESMEDDATVARRKYHSIEPSINECMWLLTLRLLETITIEMKKQCSEHGIDDTHYTTIPSTHANRALEYLINIIKHLDNVIAFCSKYGVDAFGKSLSEMMWCLCGCLQKEKFENVLEIVSCSHFIHSSFISSSDTEYRAYPAYICPVCSTTFLRQDTRKNSEYEFVVRVLSNLEPVLEYIATVSDPANYYKYSRYSYVPIVVNDRITCSIENVDDRVSIRITKTCKQ